MLFKFYLYWLHFKAQQKKTKKQAYILANNKLTNIQNTDFSNSNSNVRYGQSNSDWLTSLERKMRTSLSRV